MFVPIVSTLMGVFASLYLVAIATTMRKKKGRTSKANEVKDEMMKFNLLIRRYIELSKWIKSRDSKNR